MAQAVVVGDQQPYLCALITLTPEHLPELAQQLGLSHLPEEKLFKTPKVQQHHQRSIEKTWNTQVASYQTIKKISILPRPLTSEEEELTPTMKVKRNVIQDKYATQIGQMYES